jgi:hypothetical protein
MGFLAADPPAYAEGFYGRVHTSPERERWDALLRAADPPAYAEGFYGRVHTSPERERWDRCLRKP